MKDKYGTHNDLEWISVGLWTSLDNYDNPWKRNAGWELLLSSLSSKMWLLFSKNKAEGGNSRCRFRFEKNKSRFNVFYLNRNIENGSIIGLIRFRRTKQVATIEPTWTFRGLVHPRKTEEMYKRTDKRIYRKKNKKQRWFIPLCSVKMLEICCLPSLAVLGLFLVVLIECVLPDPVLSFVFCAPIVWNHNLIWFPLWIIELYLLSTVKHHFDQGWLIYP